MKRCKTCSKELPLSEYYAVWKRDKKYYRNVCKSCENEASRLKRLANPTPKKAEKAPYMRGFRLLPEGQRECSVCGQIKDRMEFHKDKSRASGVSSRCKVCTSEYLKGRREQKGRPDLEVRREWVERNRERLRKQDSEYRENNRDRMRLNEQRRRARKRALPDTLTEEELKDILDYFSNKCALCDGEAETLDHFIPLSTGNGGTVKENIIPLCSKMNASKHSRNPIEWAEIYLKDEEKSKFDEVVTYLAALNGMSEKEYREYVYKCFEEEKIINL